MVTLSCLIVIANLFSQVATTAPSSATPKVIEFLFFGITLRLLLVVLHHTLLSRIKARCRRVEEEEKEQGYRPKLPTVRKKDVLWSPAVYRPPGIGLPVRSWTEAGKQEKSERGTPDATSKQKATDEVSSCTGKDRRFSTCYNTVNFFCISIGFLVDLVMTLGLIFLATAYENNAIAKFEECLRSMK